MQKKFSMTELFGLTKVKIKRSSFNTFKYCGDGVEINYEGIISVF